MTAKEIIRSGCTIISYDKNKNGGLGTGFFIEMNNHIYLISNHHVVCGINNEREQMKIMCCAFDKNLRQERKLEATVYIDYDSILFSTNYDIIAYPIDDFLHNLNTSALSFDHYVIKYEDMITNYEQFEWIENVVVIGNPWGVNNITYNRPIAMGGITSTPLQHDYRNKSEFIIDCKFSHGGSGSPVFINVNNDYKLIGTLFSCIDRTEKIEKIAFDGYRIKDTYAIIPTPLNVCIKNNILLQLLQI